MKPLMKTWKIIVNVILACFGIATIVVSVFGVKRYQEGVLDKQLYDFALGSLIFGAIVCLGVVIWVVTDLCITIFKNPDNAVDEQGYYSKKKIRKYRNNFSPGRLPYLDKNKLKSDGGYFANDLKYTDEYLHEHQSTKKPTVTDQLAKQVEQRKQKNHQNQKKKHK